MLEEAKAIAKEKNENINCYQEYADAFFFFVNDGNEYVGGEGAGFVLMKNGGNILMPYEYFMKNGAQKIKIGEETMF